MALKMFVDESDQGGGQFFVVAGFLARAEQWDEFDTQWRAELASPPSVEAFHFVEARVGSAQLDKIPSLLNIIRSNVIAGFAISVRRDEFNSIVKGKVAKEIDTPYAFLYFRIIMVAIAWQLANGTDEKIYFVFDENKVEGNRVQGVYNKTIDVIEPKFSNLIGGRPTHANDKDVPGLQAADLLAGKLRKLLNSVPALSALKEEECLREFGVHILFVAQTKESLEGYLSAIKDYNKEHGRVTDHEMDHIKKDLAIHLSNYNHALLTHGRWGAIMDLIALPSTQMKRFRLVNRCPLFDIPHLHRKSSDECLGEPQI